MTEEELKDKLISEAQSCWNKLNITKRVSGSEFSYYDGYIDCGFIKEKQIQIVAEQIRSLQKQNGELAEELKLTNNECKDMREELKQRIRENQKLCEQIEKMMCCGNCRFSESDRLNGTFCHKEGCFVVASAKCKLWEN